MRLAIRCLDTVERQHLRETVLDAVATWPNDGGDYLPRENLRRAFKFLRYEMVERRMSAHGAASQLAMNVERYRDM